MLSVAYLLADGTGVFAAGKRGDASARLPFALTPPNRTDSVVTAATPTPGRDPELVLTCES
jgi:hypothetical protein